MIRSVLLFLTVSAAALAQDAEPPAGEGLKFAWPIPSKALVTQTTLKQGKRWTQQYTIELKPKGDQLELSFSNLNYLEVGGQDATTPDMQKRLAPQVAAAQATLPPMTISLAGDYVGIPDWEGFIERSAKLLESVSPEQGAQLRQIMQKPEFKRTAEPTLSRYWQTWAGLWVGVALKPGESRESMLEVPIGSKSVSTPTRVTRLADSEGNLHLQRSTRLEGAEVTQAFVDYMRELTASGPNPMTEADTQGMSFQKLTEFEVLLDPQTLRPRLTKRSETTVVAQEGKGKREQLETVECSFEWVE